MPQFEQLFEGAQFRKGMELAFTNTKSGGLAAKIDNRDVSQTAKEALEMTLSWRLNAAYQVFLQYPAF